MYSVVDLLAGPSARRLAEGRHPREIVPAATTFVPDAGELEDPALYSQEGVLSPRVPQIKGEAWSAQALRSTRMWDRDGEHNAYHAAQLVTIDLSTGEHRFHRPHQLCGLTDTFMKFRADRNDQYRDPDQSRSGVRGALTPMWSKGKWAGREWRPMVSFRWQHASILRPPQCAAPSLFIAGSSPASGSPEHIARADEASDVAALRAAVRAAMTDALRNSPRFNESLTGASVLIERPTQANGPNAWVLFPTYHGDRERFNGFCEDHAECTCTDAVGDCKAKLCRGKKLCRTLPPTSAVFVEHARTFSAALAARGALDGARVASVRASVFYDDCWRARGRCHGRRPCLEPGDQMLSCRATSMLCSSGTWPAILEKAKSWVPHAHKAASLLYLYDGPSQDLFDETFRTWSAASVGYGASPIIFGPQFASAKPRQLNTSLGLISSAVRRADACSARKNARTELIFRSPAYNIDPVNSFRQQRAFARRVRPMAEAAGAAFLDMYSATRHAVLQRTPDAIRFDHFSTFHFFDAGRYIQAQLLLHALRLI